ncbi:aminotransferase class V-fold PLP-dependent enzyme [Roseivirga misakiensis]|uniref:Aminotransferase class V n=1 Tax=Roseivirga misakiensis TaxID=1563681 RepID=A0A1E5SXV6_9BACT|nr:aminotransferase class V-fold PLP-dependent enzyme [Roseivirga misakiensis]OEK03958.1 aminotransferase class V [Roseivirga misakiensis]
MFSAKDIERFREDTDGVQKVIHFNNAGSALPVNQVRDAVVDYTIEEATYGGYETHTKHFDVLEATYEAIAKLIKADKEEIAIVENATVAWNAAFQSIDFEDGDEIITNQSDYASNYIAYLHHRKDLTVKVIPNLDNGDPDLEAFETLIGENTKLVSITHMPTNGGLVSPAEAIGEICRRHQILYLLDACQSVGQYPIDVEAIGCDFLSVTGRKYIRAPRGTGFLYVRKSTMPKLRPLTLDLHAANWTGPETYEIRSDARKFENWEGNRAALLGLKVAVEYILEIGIDKIWHRVQFLAQQVREGLSKIEGVRIHDIGTVRSGIVSFTVDGKSADEVKTLLLAQNINVSWNGVPNTFLDMTARGLKEVIRASVHYYNTEEEIETFLAAIQKLTD